MCAKTAEKDRDRVEETVARLEFRRTTLINYLIMKTEEEDWHGVADAAMDLRELEAKLSVMREEES